MKKITQNLLLLFGNIAIILSAIPAKATSVLNDALTTAERTNSNAQLPDANDPNALVGTIIGYVLGFLGTIFLILIIYGGFLWMTAGGNEQQIEKAKKILTQSTIGLLIVVLAYTITLFVIDTILGATNAPV